MSSSQVKRPTDGVILSVTFQYYKELARACAFYEDVLGLKLAIDQGWSKIYAIGGGAHIGLVDEVRGMQKWAAQKTVQICLRVPDVDAWFAWVESQNVERLVPVKDSEELGIRAFAFNDPEGYQIEIQTAKPGH